MGTPFIKMTGSGNDFVFVDGRYSPVRDWPADRISAACDRRRGIGADGLVVLEAEADGPVRMHYFNADGGRAALCGNAALCSTRLAVRLGLASAAGMVLRTDAGELQTRCTGPGHLAEIRFPAFPVPPAVDLDPAHGETGPAWLGDIGVPHLIVPVTSLGAVDVPGRGRVLRFDPRYGPAGTNVNFVARLTGDPEAPGWGVRTYERGVEGETMACGTGTVCAAFALARAGLAELPLRVRTGSGSVLSVSGRIEGDRCEDVWLCGEGRVVFDGVWEEG